MRIPSPPLLLFLTSTTASTVLVFVDAYAYANGPAAFLLPAAAARRARGAADGASAAAAAYPARGAAFAASSAVRRPRRRVRVGGCALWNSEPFAGDGDRDDNINNNEGGEEENNDDDFGGSNKQEELFFDDFGDFVAGSSPPLSSSSSTGAEMDATTMSSLTARIVSTRSDQIKKDALLNRNWRSGNWKVRGFSLDKADPVREAEAAAAAAAAARVGGRGEIGSGGPSSASSYRLFGNTRRTNATDGGVDPAAATDGAAAAAGGQSSVDTDSSSIKRRSSGIDATTRTTPTTTPPEPVHVSRIVPDSSRIRSPNQESSSGGDGGDCKSDVVAVGRTDGTVCIVKLGTEYVTKFTAVPKLKVDDPSVWGRQVEGGGGGGGDETDGGDDPSARTDEGKEGDDDTASTDGPTVRIESELVRSDVLREEVRRLGLLTGDTEDGDGHSGGAVPREGEDPYGDGAYADGDAVEDYFVGEDEGRGRNPSGADEEEQREPEVPFEVLTQFRAHEPGESIVALLLDDDTVYTAGGDTGVVRVWSMPEKSSSSSSESSTSSSGTAAPLSSSSLPSSSSSPPPTTTPKMIPIRNLAEVHTDRIVALKTLSSVGDADDRDLLLSASRDGSYALWDTESGDLVYRSQMVDEYSNPVSITCADVDASSSDDGDQAIFLGLETGHVVGYFVSDIIGAASVGGTRPVPSCRYLAHGEEASGLGEEGGGGDGIGGRVRKGVTSILCAGDGTISLTPGGSGSGAPSSSSSRPRTIALLTGGADGTVKRWEIMSRKLRGGSDDDASPETPPPSFKLEHWPRLSTQRMKRRAHLFRGHSAPVAALACTDRTKFLSASADGSVRVWDPQQGTELYRLDGFTKAISSLCLDRETLVTDGQEEFVCLHDFNVNKTAPEEGHHLEEW